MLNTMMRWVLWPNCASTRTSGMGIQAKARRIGHSHKFTIADDEAVRSLVEKLAAAGGSPQLRRDKLLRALDDATRHYKDSNQKVRRAFFHGLLTGYGVALRLR